MIHHRTTRQATRQPGGPLAFPGRFARNRVHQRTASKPARDPRVVKAERILRATPAGRRLLAAFGDLAEARLTEQLSAYDVGSCQGYLRELRDAHLKACSYERRAKSATEALRHYREACRIRRAIVDAESDLRASRTRMAAAKERRQQAEACVKMEKRGLAGERT